MPVENQLHRELLDLELLFRQVQGIKRSRCPQVTEELDNGTADHSVARVTLIVQSRKAAVKLAILV